MPSRAITSRICSRRRGVPCPEPYCSATAPDSRTVRSTADATSSWGSADTYGMPPASDTTSGRLATANSARTSEALSPAVRWA